MNYVELMGKERATGDRSAPLDSSTERQKKAGQKAVTSCSSPLVPPLSAFWSLIGYNDTPAHIVFLMSLYMHKTSVFIAQMFKVIKFHGTIFLIFFFL